MKIGIIGDIHFSEYSSILRSKGNKYSTRLENCLQSINWAESLTNSCDQVIYLGDFFDKSSLNASELTALSDIAWNNQPHKFLVGNHELGVNNLIISSAHVLGSVFNKTTIIDKPIKVIYDDIELCFLPYILETDREKFIENYFGPRTDLKRIIFSHNDIAGISLGKFVSKTGFSIHNIEFSCDLFINGHIHNGSRLTDTIINIGNLTGQNFSEDAFTYKHNIMILDTNTMTYELYENPYAINFYKLSSILQIDDLLNAVVTIKASSSDVNSIKNKLNNSSNIITYRVIVENATENVGTVTDLSVDHLEEFKKFVLREIGNSDLVLEELSIING